MKRYMDSSDDNHTDSHVIQLKTCPRCNTPIRTSLRYGNVIKQRLQDIEKVKVAAYGHPSEMEETKESLHWRLADLRMNFNGEDTERDLERLQRSVNRLAKGTMTVVTENQVTLMERWCMMSKRMNEHLREPLGKLYDDVRLEGMYSLSSSYQVNQPYIFTLDHCNDLLYERNKESSFTHLVAFLRWR